MRRSLHVDLPEEIVDDLDRWARDDGIPRAELVRRMIMEFHADRKADEQS
jgi:metal-responsive CopG/Arc/MetJ family transcriptional regulator